MFPLRKVLYSGQSAYSNYKVVDTTYDGRQARLLYGDQNTPQSGMALDDEGELLFDYNQRFLEMLASKRPKSVLVIGGGVMMLPVAAYDRFADMMIDVVEIDPLLVQLAHNYFRMPTSERFNVFTADGKHYLEQTSKRYDMIIIDAFYGYSIPPHLVDRAAAALYRQHLTHNGLVALNFISQYVGHRRYLAHEIIANFSESFPSCELYQSDPHQAARDEQNLLLVASSLSEHFDYLRSAPVQHLMTI